MAPLHPADALTEAALKLHRTAAPWMITGSVAATVYGRERTTLDIDIVVDLSDIDPGQFAAAFAPEYMLEAEMVRDSLSSGIMFNALPLQGGAKIDLIPLDRGDSFRSWAFETRQPFEWHGVPVWVSSAPALVLSKLLWAQQSGSERQLADVRAIMSHEDVTADPEFWHWIQHLDLHQTLEASRETRYDA